MGNCLTTVGKVNDAPCQKQHQQLQKTKSNIDTNFQEPTTMKTLSPTIVTNPSEPQIQINAPLMQSQAKQSALLQPRAPSLDLRQLNQPQESQCSKSNCEHSCCRSRSSSRSKDILSQSENVAIEPTESVVLRRQSQQIFNCQALSNPKVKITQTASYLVNEDRLSKLDLKNNDTHFTLVNSQIIVSKIQLKKEEFIEQNFPNFEQSIILVKNKQPKKKGQQNQSVHRNIEQSTIMIKTKQQQNIKKIEQAKSRLEQSTVIGTTQLPSEKEHEKSSKRLVKSSFEQLTVIGETKLPNEKEHIKSLKGQQ